jgi:predicted ATPase
MLKSITIENFFSFGEAQKIELNSGVNILIGINGSGKSNFIRAIELLYEATVGSGFHKLFQQKWGGFNSVKYLNGSNNNSIKFIYEFDLNVKENNLNTVMKNLFYELEIYSNGKMGYYLSERFYEIRENNQLITYVHTYGGNDVFKAEYKVVDESTRSDESFLKQINFSSFNPISPLVKLRDFLKNMINYDKFDLRYEGKLRSLSPTYTEEKLLPNGENFTDLLNNINNNDEATFEKIVGLVKSVNPNFKGLGFKIIGSKILLTLKENNLDQSVPIEFISDGTLQFLLLLLIFYNQKRGYLVVFDEPDPYLHPDMINGIAKGIKHAAATGTQMIIATHSPLLLNDFELKDVLIFEKDKNNQSIVNRKSIKEFEHWEGDFLVGQMWLSGQLGGVRW